ncbi:MAG: SDR family oxidoreductase [Polyangiales bacterium]
MRRGIGRDRRALREGVTVYGVARDRAKLESLESEHKGRFYGAAVDLVDTESLAEVVDTATKAMSGLSGLVNCAGVVRNQEIGAIEIADAVHDWKVNFLAPLMLAQAAAQKMKEKGGAIVNVCRARCLCVPMLDFRCTQRIKRR